MTYDGSMAQAQTQIGRVDVIVPTYQETERLERAIASAVTQGNLVSRIHVLDDGSETNVAKVLTERYSGAANVVLTLLGHTGLPGKLRQLALVECNAEWVAFLDADDYWKPNKLSRQLDLAKHHKLDMVFTNATEVSVPSGNTKAYFPVGVLNNPIHLFDLLKKNLVVNSSVLVKREALLSVGGVACSKFVHGAEDYATWLRIAAVGKIGVLDEELVVYEKSSDSFSRKERRYPQVRGLVDFLFWTSSQAARISGAGSLKLRSEILSAIAQIIIVKPLKTRVSRMLLRK